MIKARGNYSMRRTIGYMCCFVAAMLSASLFALPGPSSATFAKGAKFTVAGYTNENGTARAELQNLPVLVRIAENSPSGFSVKRHCTKPQPKLVGKKK